MIETGECIWATVKTIDFDKNTYANNVYWVVCDVINEAENTIYRYTSKKVKEDIFDKITPGNQIAIYVNPDDPDDYYVNLNQIM